MAIKLSAAAARRLGLTAKKAKTATDKSVETARRAMIGAYCRAHGLPEPEYEVLFHPTRKWRFDMLFQRWLAVEIDGVTYAGGRHQRIGGFIADMEKQNAATVLGYRILRFLPRQIDSGMAFQTIKEALGEL